MKILIAAWATLIASVLAIAAVAGGPGLGATPPSAAAVDQIPPSLLPVYVGATATCPGLPWQILAAIGTIESDHGSGRLDPATGNVYPPILGPALDGTNGYARIPDPIAPDGWAHAAGPMQFLTTTWNQWGRLAPGRPVGAAPDVNNAWDAIYTAAAYLCGPDDRIDNLDEAILSYNHSLEYLADVRERARLYSVLRVWSSGQSESLHQTNHEKLEPSITIPPRFEGKPDNRPGRRLKVAHQDTSLSLTDSCIGSTGW